MFRQTEQRLPATIELLARSVEHHNWLMTSNEETNGPELRSVQKLHRELGAAQ